MFAPVLVAVLAGALTPPADDMTRNILTQVCLPYVTGAANDPAALESLGFVAASGSDDDSRNYQTSDQAHLLRLTTAGSAEDGNLNRVCVIQARRGGLEGARGSVAPVLQEQGFAPEADLPADRPIWTRAGVTVSLRQNEGRATIIRVTYSSLDAEEL